MSLIVPTIFLSRDPREVDLAFPRNSGVVNLEAVGKSNSSKFFKSSQGGNIVSLVHEVRFSSQEPTKITIEIVDPEREFEKFFLSPVESNRSQETSAIITDNQVIVQAPRPEFGEKVFVAYGFGNRREDWSAPHVVTFVDLKVDVGSDGIRRFIVGFVPFNRPIVTKAFSFPGDGNLRCTGESDVDPRINSPDSFTPRQKVNIQVKKINFSKIVQECVETFLKRAAGTKNVITLIPEVEQTHSVAISRIKEIREKVETYSANGIDFSVNISQIDRDVFGDTILYRQVEGRIRDFLGKNFGIQVSYETPVFDAYENSKLEFAGARIKNFFIENFALLGGGEVVANERKNALSKIRGTKAVLEGEVEEGIEGAKRINYAKVFDTLANGFANGDTYSPRMQLIFETDRETLDLWYEYGYIEDFDTPAVIYGDQNLINHFLYGKFYHVDPEKVAVIDYAREVDVDKFSDKERIKTLARYAKAEHGWFNRFPDELALDNLKKLVEAFDIPVFRHGYSNSDILDLSINLDQAFFAALNFGIGRKKAISATRALASRIDLLGNLRRSKEEIIEKLKEWAGPEFSDPSVTEKRNELIREFSINLVERSFPVADTREQQLERDVATGDLIEFLENLLDQNEEDLSESILLDENNDNIAAGLLLQILEESYKAGYRASIRTLPRFRASFYGVVGTPSVLLARHPYVVGVNSSNVASDSFYSGLYTISGFRHTLSTDLGAFSEFELVKSPQSAGVDIFQGVEFDEGIQGAGNG